MLEILPGIRSSEIVKMFKLATVVLFLLVVMNCSENVFVESLERNQTSAASVDKSERFLTVNINLYQDELRTIK